MSVQLILEKLEKVKPNGQGKWMACCPSHDDRSPSLGIAELQDGRILLNCLAGCGVHEVLGALGMGMEDLFPDGGAGHRMKGYFQMIKPKEKTVYDETLLALADAKRSRGERLTPKEMELERQAFMRGRNRCS